MMIMMMTGNMNIQHTQVAVHVSWYLCICGMKEASMFVVKHTTVVC